MSVQNTLATQKIIVDDTEISDQMMAERFEIVSFRGAKFKNHEEDSSVVDSLSDCPDIMDVCRFFRNCDK
jgi:hypothetical protein